MAVSIVRPEPGDIDEMVAVGQAAFADDKLAQAHFMLNTATTQQLDEYNLWRKELVRARMNNPNSVYFKAVDESSGAILGYIGMFDPQGEPPSGANLSVPRPTRMNKDLDDELRTRMKATKEKWISDRKDVWYVQSMAVHPQYQGRGIATKLVRRAVEPADEAGQDVYLEGTEAGLKLYQRCGFEKLESIPVEGVDYNLVAMMRHPNAAPTN